MSILGLFMRKSSNRSEARSVRGSEVRERGRRGSSSASVNLLDHVGRFEVSE